MRDLPFDPKCHARHLGVYAIHGPFMEQAVAQIKVGAYPTRAAGAPDEGRPLYALTPDGIAVIQLSGPILKGGSKFPHTNSLETRRAVRAAVRDGAVKAILLHIDSPGGSAAGTQELADDVHQAAQAKPVVAHIDDLGASAAYWIASQARSVSVNQAGSVGSIGVFAVVHDTSAAMEKKGVEVKVVTTGDFKGAFIPGAAIPDHHLEELQREVDATHGLFLAAVERGRADRGLSGDALEAAADGRVFGAADALGRSLVDRVASLDEVVSDLSAEIVEADEERNAATRKREERLHRLRRRR